MATGLDPDSPGDETNPYAPPRSQLGPRSRGEPPAIVPFDFGCILGATWALYKERLGACIAVCWTVLALTWGIQFWQTRLLRELAVPPGDRLQYFLVQLAVFVGVNVFNIWLSIGQNLAMLAVARGEPSVLERVFHGGRFVLTTILATVLFMLVLGLIVLVNLIWIPILSGLVGPRSLAIVLVFVVGIAIACIVSIYVSARFSQFPYMILDHNAGAVDSLRWSWEVTQQRVGTLIVVYAMLSLINLGGLLACFVGLLFTAPFTGLMLAVTYLSMTGQPMGGKKPAPRSWDEVSFETD
jgi:hypothetical protein